MLEKKEKYIRLYFNYIGKSYFLDALENFRKKEGFGQEYVWCCFANEYEKWEEDYFGESGVAFYFEYPAVEEDCTIILSNEEFYKYLVDECKDYIKKYPKDEDVVHNYLSVIKKKLKL